MAESKCELCGEPMPAGEEMFKFHGYSGPCPKPPLPRKPTAHELVLELARKQAHADGFREGWYAALSRVRDGESPDELSALLPAPRATV